MMKNRIIRGKADELVAQGTKLGYVLTQRQNEEIERAHINFYSPKRDAHSRWSIFKIISNHFEYSAFKALANLIGRNWPMQASLIG